MPIRWAGVFVSRFLYTNYRQLYTFGPDSRGYSRISMCVCVCVFGTHNLRHKCATPSRSARFSVWRRRQRCCVAWRGATMCGAYFFSTRNSLRPETVKKTRIILAHAHTTHTLAHIHTHMRNHYIKYVDTSA